MQNNKLESKKADILQEQLRVSRRQDRRGSLLLHFAMVLTGLLYFMFEKHLFLGEAITWNAYFQEWHSALDFILMFVIVVMSAVFLAWVKHHAYLHFGLYGSIGAVVFTVVAFAIFAEFFSSSASQDTKSRVLLLNDKAYQSTFTPAVTAPTPLLGTGNAAAIAKAEQAYARCQANLGKPGYSHCNGDKANLDSLKASDAASLAAASRVAVETNTATLAMNYNRQDKLKADSYNAVIVSIAKFLGGISGTDYKDNIKLATVLIMLVVAVAFEKLHHFLSHAKERSQNAVYALELELAKVDGSFIPEKPESVLPKNDGIGFGFLAKNEPASNSHPTPSFKYQHEQPKEDQAKPEKSFGFLSRESIPANAARESLDAENRRKYPQTILFPNATGKTPDDYSVIPRKDIVQNTDSPTPSKSGLSGNRGGAVAYLAPTLTPASPSRDLNSVTGHEKSVTSVTSVTESVTDEEKAEMLEKVAALEQKLATQKAEMEAQAERDLENRSRMEANAQAKLEAEKAEKERAEKVQAERDRIRDLENRSRAEAAEKEARSREAEIRSRAEAAAEQAARDLAATEAAAAEKAERGGVTDEQIELATAVIKTAIVEGHIQKVGSPQTSPILKAAGLPTSSDTLKVLSKFACKALEAEGLVIQNPNKANGQPLYLIA